MSKNIRKILFWLHLVLGCSAAIFIFLMSITGVGLTYERQMIKSAERADYPLAQVGQNQVLPLVELMDIAKRYPTKKTTEIIIMSDENSPMLIKDGRKTIAFINPFTGEEMTSPGAETKAFFSKLRAFHRWLTLDGKFSETGRWVNGIANTFFIVLAISGLYLWLPKRFNTRAFKQKLTINKHHPSVKARNYQWHNVFSFYALPILFVIAFTAIFFSFKWPGEKLKQYVSSDALSLPKAKALSKELLTRSDFKVLGLQQQLTKIKQEFPQWQTIRFSISKSPTDIHHYHIDNGNGGEPQKRVSVALNTLTGQVVQVQKFDQLSDYRKTRSIIRFLHTGEVFGLLGQTLAGLASLLACLLVYTGVMLSWARWKNSRNPSNNTDVINR